ncbi:MAG TPA: hypothetical protein VFN87_09030 [Solirubrobacteraceae bacterium]|nr:hypothetical protein [Solirubrobacteraceae bacterium]
MSPSTTYERALARELIAVGITGRLRARILDEFADHLACDPDAPLGDPRELARDFADVIGSARAKTAAVAAFASLVVAGVLFVLVVGGIGGGLLRSAQAAGGPLQGPPALATVAAAIVVVATQVAFAAGCLAALRWLWRREASVLPAAEAAILLRRAATGVGAGIVSMASLAVIVLATRHQPGAQHTGLAVAGAAAGVVALASALPSLWSASRLRPVMPGAAGDLIDDLGPLALTGLRGRPWRVALLLAGAIVVAATALGVVTADPYDGALRGIADGLACLFGFATLGRYLGLWGGVGAPRQHTQAQ